MFKFDFNQTVKYLNQIILCNSHFCCDLACWLTFDLIRTISILVSYDYTGNCQITH